MSEVHLSSVSKESGQLLFLFPDKFSTYAIYRPGNERRLFIATMDKRLFILRTDYANIPDWFFDYSHIRFNHPKVDGDVVNFTGFVTVKSKNYSFSFSENEALTYKEVFDVIPLEKHYALLSSLSCMSDITVKSGKLFKDKFYFTGLIENAPGEEHPVYGVVDVKGDKLECFYYLYSDVGEISPESISIDYGERVVYVVGTTLVFKDDSCKIVDYVPFIEQFMFK